MTDYGIPRLGSSGIYVSFDVSYAAVVSDIFSDMKVGLTVFTRDSDDPIAYVSTVELRDPLWFARAQQSEEAAA